MISVTLLALLLLAVAAAIAVFWRIGNDDTPSANAPSPETNSAAGTKTVPPGVAKTSSGSARKRLAAAKSWAYWLQNINVRKAAATPFDVLVLDYSRDGTDQTALSPADVEALKQKSDGSRRLVGCYLSVGEAEDYRYYWNASWRGGGKPQWIRGENKDWAGNYIVNFWDPEWQALLMGSPDAYLDRILAQGFDAVYLDRVDVYAELKRQRPTAERDMVALIAKISAYAKARNPDFGVIMQNAEELIEHAGLEASIDAIAKEDLLYGLARDGARNTDEDITDCCSHLDRAKKAGIAVFVVEYLKDAPTQTTAAKELVGFGYTATFAPRNLGRIYEGVA